MAENALLEERLDEAAAAIETARKAGVDGGRIAFLAAQLANPRRKRRAKALRSPRSKAADRRGRRRGQSHQPPRRAADQLRRARLATQRISEGRLIDPERDSARHYVQEALRADPHSEKASQAKRARAESVGRGACAIDRRDFAAASNWLEAATGIAAPAKSKSARPRSRRARVAPTPKHGGSC